MTTELRVKNQAQQIYVRALSSAWRGMQLHDPSLWLQREPEIEEKMLRDGDIAHAVGYRRHLIAGRDWTVTPRVESRPNAKLAVHVGETLLGGIKHFTNARFNLARAFFSGARFAKIHGETKVLTLGDGRPRTWWVPRRLEDLDKRMFRVVPKTDDATGKVTAHWEKWNVGRQRFEVQSVDDAVTTIRHVYQDDQAQLGYGKALREALGWVWYAKTHVFQEALQAVERFAQGILSAKVDGIRDAATGLPNAELMEAWANVLEDLRSRHVIVYDSSDHIEHVQLNGEGWQLIERMLDRLKSMVFTLTMGANLTTAADDGGSYALAEIQENSTEALVQFDRQTLEETLTDDLIGCVWFMNHANLFELGLADDKPRLAITQEKRQDPKERAEVASVLSGMGVDLSLVDVLEQTGFKKPEEGEDIVEGGSSNPDPFGGFGLPPAFGGQPQPQQPQPQQPQTATQFQ